MGVKIEQLVLKKTIFCIIQNKDTSFNRIKKNYKFQSCTNDDIHNSMIV